MRSLIFVSFFLLHITTSAQTYPNVHEHYDEIFFISKEKYQDKEYLRKGVRALEEEHPLANLVNNNKSFLDYWLTNFVNREMYRNLMAVEDEKELQEEFIAALENDSLFKPLMAKFSAKVTDPAVAKDTVTVDEVLNVAVKYFNIIGITEEGSYKGKVCAGLNGITQTLSKREPELEAFCFSTVLQNLRGEEYNLHNEFVAAIRELYKQELGVDREERLLRAQGAMFAIMRNNKQLKNILISEYERKKEFLPFVIEYSPTASKG